MRTVERKPLSDNMERGAEQERAYLVPCKETKANNGNLTAKDGCDTANKKMSKRHAAKVLHRSQEYIHLSPKTPSKPLHIHSKANNQPLRVPLSIPTKDGQKRTITVLAGELTEES